MAQTGAIEKLFEIAGFPYNTIDENESINIEDKKIEIQSYDHDTDTVIFKKVISLTRKHNAICYNLYYKGTNQISTPVLRGTKHHKVFDPVIGKYFSITDARHVLKTDGSIAEVYSIKDNTKLPILDLEVEDTNCYFTNGILSHNTPGGRALKFYSSMIVDIRRTGKKIESESTSIRVKLVKNKLGVPFGEGEFSLIYGEGIDTLGELIDKTVEYDIITPSGSWFSIDGQSIHGKEKLKIYLEANPTLIHDLHQQLNDAVAGK